MYAINGPTEGLHSDVRLVHLLLEGLRKALQFTAVDAPTMTQYRIAITR